MQNISNVADMVTWRRNASGVIAFVPTMGALHAGHVSLIEQARSLADVVVVSIFVNPKQFAPGGDYDRYPRTLDEDLQQCSDLGVDVVFTPEATDMFRPGGTVSVSSGELGRMLEGAARPGHFDGVATVVAKFLNIVQPSVIILGEKDAQQLVVIRAVVSDLNLPVTVVGGSIVREIDGLAMSSRNRYLTQEDRRAAQVLSKALWAAAARAATLMVGPVSVEDILVAARHVLHDTPDDMDLTISYLTLVYLEDFVELAADEIIDPNRPLRLLIAGCVGGTRLIDNTAIEVPAFIPVALVS